MMKFHATVLGLCCLFVLTNGFFTGSKNKKQGCNSPRIENGRHDGVEAGWFINSHPVFTKLKFTCDDGYYLSGPQIAECQMTKKWTELPKCMALPGTKSTKKICSIPPTGDGVRVLPSKYRYDLNDVVIFVCPMTVRKSASYHQVICTSDGTFEPPPPKCIDPLCVPPKTPYGGGLVSNQPSYKIGETAYFKCNEGYRLVGTDSVTCRKNGTFPYAETKCEVVLPAQKKCAAGFPDVNRRQLLINGDLYLWCKTGFKIQGRTRLICLPSGEWSDRFPICKRSCRTPKHPANGFLMTRRPNYYTVGDIAEFSCYRGYKMNGVKFSTCMENGEFSRPPPTCESSNVYTYSIA